MYARLDTLWVKLFEEEQDRTVAVLLDCSASMKGEKLDYARQVGAAIAYVALGQADRVLVAGLSDTLAHYSPARRGRRATGAVFRSIEEVHPGGGSDPQRAIAALPRQRGASIGLLFTDFLYEEGAEEALRRLRSRGMELHAFHVMAPWELRPELEGDVLLVDAETGEGVPVSLGARSLDRYEATVREWSDEVAEVCRRVGVSYTRLLTSVPVDEVILRTLRDQGVLA